MLGRWLATPRLKELSDSPRATVSPHPALLQTVVDLIKTVLKRRFRPRPRQQIPNGKGCEEHIEAIIAPQHANWDPELNLEQASELGDIGHW